MCKSIIEIRKQINNLKSIENRRSLKTIVNIKIFENLLAIGGLTLPSNVSRLTVANAY